eukprot:jgi/Botrbrau1/1991/Bobra.0052s0033.1
MIQDLEAENGVEEPAIDLNAVSGRWLLLYTTITIRGFKRSKLGLGDLVALGQFVQEIDPVAKIAVNHVEFDVLGRLEGTFRIIAAFESLSKKRVSIKYLTSELEPEQVASLFKNNYELLLSIFNPEGWLDITYVDDTLRVGRDDKDNVFVLQRC